MTHLLVKQNQLFLGDKVYRCAIGKGGLSVAKREGDGCTPLGQFMLRECWYRPDKLTVPKTSLALRTITQQDGWCDDPSSSDYNRHVSLPFAYSHEMLWRADDVYDLIVPLGYNDEPVLAGKGSAIFMHVAKPQYEPTEGCVALAKTDLLDILKHCDPASLIEIQQS
ncbi:MAG: L,D-transpeptidase family protein [Rickettsiales bacterium]|nr:L,D-transpeptidase family protein [Rickettsiales bacterium]